MSEVVATYGADVTRTRVTLANEVRVKFLANGDGVDHCQAIKAARALRDFPLGATITLRGRLRPADDGGLRTTRRTTNRRTVGKYDIAANLNAMEWK